VVFIGLFLQILYKNNGLKLIEFLQNKSNIGMSVDPACGIDILNLKRTAN